jgi:hypothetical protein
MTVGRPIVTDVAIMGQLVEIAGRQAVVGLRVFAIGEFRERVSDDDFVRVGIEVGERVIDVADAVEGDVANPVLPRVVNSPGRIVTGDDLVGGGAAVPPSSPPPPPPAIAAIASWSSHS